jgi:2'-5' RNA ligase
VRERADAPGARPRGPHPKAGRAAIETVRAFVAILLANGLRARLAAEVDRLRPLARDVAWVRGDNFHLTLKFLGGVEARRLEAIAAALAEVAQVHPAFELGVRELGAFPSRTRPRVLWAGVEEGAEAAAALAAGVDAALGRLGFEPEGRAFTAHITLGRVRAPRAQPRLTEALRGGIYGRQRVDHLSLMRSELSPRGARHTELAALPMAPGA